MGDAINATKTFIIPFTPITLGPLEANPAATSPQIRNYEMETGIPTNVTKMQVTAAPIKTLGKHKANKIGSFAYSLGVIISFVKVLATPYPSVNPPKNSITLPNSIAFLNVII